MPPKRNPDPRAVAVPRRLNINDVTKETDRPVITARTSILLSNHHTITNRKLPAAHPLTSAAAWACE